MRIPLTAITLLVALAGCANSTSGSPVAGQTVPSAPATTTTETTSSSSAPTSTAGGGKACDFQATPDQPAPAGKDVGLPPAQATDKPASVVLTTGGGAVTITLTVDAAPCTTRSFIHLAGKKFYDNTACHRLTTSQGLKVLQCGDPQGTGAGGPGYSLPDENPTTLKPGPATGGAETVIYPRGTVAMANTGQPHSGGSQFFIVWGDSTLPPDYAVFGSVDAAGLAVLDKIAGAGTADGGQDGAPKDPVTIQQAVVHT
jgi:peptidyl-prolyl cis-trans isomerase B (cyclophilin B)